MPAEDLHVGLGDVDAVGILVHRRGVGPLARRVRARQVLVPQRARMSQAPLPYCPFGSGICTCFLSLEGTSPWDLQIRKERKQLV